MPKIIHAGAYLPPPFPLRGRLPTESWQVARNLHCQSDQERAYHDSLCVAAGRRVTAPCCKTLHITLCFDGTGNNLYNDIYVDSSAHPTNISRIFLASIGAGYAGGTGHVGVNLTDAEGTGDNKYFRYYMPGVGTPFPEIGELDYGISGLAGGRFGEERLNWALMMIIDALRRAHRLPLLDNRQLLAALEEMGTWLGVSWATGPANRARIFRKHLEALHRPLQIAMNQPYPGHPKLLGIKVYVYGFSRGAALARAFVNWLNSLLAKDTAVPSLGIRDLRLPIQVEYLGLLDTVASVGMANVIGGIDGHMGWADGSQAIPEGGLVKRCLHMVAAHEQRLCFPLESIRKANGEYPANSFEVIYPGVHSDVGGGYAPGEQGKALGGESDTGDSMLLSQILLHDMYQDAFIHGAALRVPEETLPTSVQNEFYRVLNRDDLQLFSVAPSLIEKFNAWRKVTGDAGPAPSSSSADSLVGYHPIPASGSIEQCLRDQMSWLTAWRIDRYAFASLKQTPFYLQAPDLHADPQARDDARAKQAQAHALLNNKRLEQKAAERDPRVPKRTPVPGLKDFEPVLDQTQLREAAEEFAADFRGPGLFKQLVLWQARNTSLPVQAVYRLTVNSRSEREAMKAAGQARVTQLFPPFKGYYRSHIDENTRIGVDEQRNADQPEGLLRALFDDHVHDSRAWFLHDLFGIDITLDFRLGLPKRELGGSYFAERMVFFEAINRRDLALYSAAEIELLARNEAVESMQDLNPAPVLTDTERMAEVHRTIDEQWAAMSADAAGVNNGRV